MSKVGFMTEDGVEIVDGNAEGVDGVYVQENLSVKVLKKINTVMQKSGYIAKDKRNSAQKYNYLSEEEVIYRMRELMVAEGLVVVPSTEEVSIDMLERPGDKPPMPMTTVSVLYKIIDIDSGEYIAAYQCGSGSDMMDKGIYKALTGCNKYYLLKLFQIPTGDDPDKDFQVEPEPVSSPAQDKEARTERYKAAVAGVIQAYDDQTRAAIIKSALSLGTADDYLSITESSGRMAFVTALKEEAARVDAMPKEQPIKKKGK